MVETEARSPAERPGAFILSCSKCTRELEVHGREDLLSIIAEQTGWTSQNGRGVCPKCAAAREIPEYNKAREQGRRARRAA